MFLVDTNIISVVAPTKRRANEALREWLDRASQWLYLSVVTAAEIRSGIVKAEREGAASKASLLRAWWQAVEHIYGTRILPFDLAAARAAGDMLDRSRAYAVGFEDIAIAATATVNGLAVLTNNERDFLPLGVEVLNPLKALPRLPG